MKIASAPRSLSPEARLLLLSAGGSDNDPEIASLLGAGIDWPRLAWLADWENAGPVLWQRLCEVAPDRLSGESGSLRQLAMVGAFRVRQIESRLGEVVARLDAEGMPVMLLKGAALASTVYPTFASRPMSDIDLLLHSEQAHRARALLTQWGWRSEGPDSLDEVYGNYHHLRPLRDVRRTGVSLELHTALFPPGHPFRIPLADFERDGLPIVVGGHSVYVLPPALQLLHTCLHLAWSHILEEEGSWRTFRDIAAITSGMFEWDDFIDLARDSRGATACYWPLRLARTLSGIHVPPDVLRLLRPPHSAYLLNRLETHYSHHLMPGEFICPSATVRYRLWQIGMSPKKSGYGSARPWKTLIERFKMLGDSQSSPDTVARRALRQARYMGSWARYLRTVLVRPRGHRRDDRAGIPQVRRSGRSLDGGRS
ncbi:MAG: nucleotidyltransferase domain-containing protein [Gemmatimonadaceae bacterium]